MNTGTKSSAGNWFKVLFPHLICILTVFGAAALVRTAPVFFRGAAQKTRSAYVDEQDIPYLTDLDSYYYARLVDNYLSEGSLGDTVSDDGQAWDSLSYYPEGRGAQYQPVIAWLTAGIWRLFGGSLNRLEYVLPAFIAALSAVAAYLIGWRMNGKAGGLASGLLVSCAPVYASRTCFGRFDTDMFIVFLELLLIFFLTEALRASSRIGRLLYAVLFAADSVLYFLCWTPTYGMLFAGLTLAGGLLYCLVCAVTAGIRCSSGESGTGSVFWVRQLLILMAAGALMLAGALLLYGTNVIKRVISAISFTPSSAAGTGVLPNLLESVSELFRPRVFPKSMLKAFAGYVPGGTPSVVSGVGGAVVFGLSLAGIILLLAAGFLRFRGKNVCVSGYGALLYTCVLGAWFAAGIYLSRYGVRFIEHLSVPVGLLAAVPVGRLNPVSGTSEELSGNYRRRRIFFLAKRLASAALLAAAAIPCITGAVRACAASRPSVTDASVNAMRYITKNAQDQDAVIASWWDMGYFYEKASGHPCLWDGGTQNGARAILVAKALTSDSLDLSRRILLMLSCSGNEAINLLMEHTDAASAFETLWTVLVSEKDEALALLSDRCGFDRAEAEEAWKLMRPDEPKETYLVLTYTMTRQIGWYEYYAGWDFTGRQAKPSSTLYTYTPSGTPLFRSEEGQEYMESVRGKEMMWRLFFNAERTDCFTPAFEWHDGLEHVRIWKVENG